MTQILTTGAAWKTLPLSWSGGTLNSEPAGWKSPGFNDSGWDAGYVPPDPNSLWAIIAGADFLSNQALRTGGHLESAIWIGRREFTLAALPDIARVRTNSDDFQQVWVNGTLVVASPGFDYDSPRSVDISPYLVVGANCLAIKVTNTSQPANDWTHNPTMAQASIDTGFAVSWDVYDRADPNGPILATLVNAFERQFRAELNGTGSGSFKINRHAAEATADVLAKGNVVKVRIDELGDDYVFAFILEQGDFTLLSIDEEGGETLTFGGRGVLAYLDRAVMWDEAFTTGLDITDTWTEIWETTGISKPSGVAFDSAESGYVYVAHLTTRKVAKVRQSDRVVVAWSPALWSDASHYLAGISFDPSDNTIMWALEAPWLAGSSDPTRVRKIQRSDWSTLVNTSLGSAIKHTDIRADASELWLSRYDGTTTIYERSKSNPATVIASHSISYKGVVQTHANGIAINGTKIAYWFGGTDDHGTGRALVASTSAPTTITEVQDTSGITAYGGEWTTEGGQDYLYAVNFALGKTWKYQLTAATPHDPLDGIWRLDEATPGAILARLIAEWQSPDRPQAPLPDLTDDFDFTDDSDGNAWATHDGTAEFDANVGDRGLDTVLRLIPYGLTVQISPYLGLSGYNDFGIDRSSASFAAGKVRFVVGVNIADTLQRRLDERQADSHMLVGGDGNVFVPVTEDDLGYVREGFLGTQLKDTTAMTGTGEAELAREREIADSVAFNVLWGSDEAAGLYLPGPAGSSGHYWVGDTVRCHTGSGEVDFDEQNLRVYAITVREQENGDWIPTVELISPFLLEPTVSSAGSSGSSSSSSTTPPTGGSSGGTTTGKVNVRDDVTGITVAATTIAGDDHVVVESPSGTAVLGHRWPRLDQLEGLDLSGAADGQVPIWNEGDVTWEPGDVEEIATAATDPSLVLAPDGSGGVEFRAETTGETLPLTKFDRVDLLRGFSLTKQGVVISPGGVGSWKRSLVESPDVFWSPEAGKYAMEFVGYTGAVGSPSVAAIGVATADSPDGPWTEYASNPVFSASGSGADSAGVGGPVQWYEDGAYYRFYIGLTATGYEAGTKSMCVAVSTDYIPGTNAGTWTRHKGIIVPTSGWRATAIFHPCIVKRASTYYMFFNAANAIGTEQIGLATSTDIIAWTVDDAHSPVVTVGAGGSWNSATSGDPDVFREGETWYMVMYGYDGSTNAGDGYYFTSDADFPYGWKPFAGNPILTHGGVGSIDALHAHKPSILLADGRIYHWYTAVDGGSPAGREIALATQSRSGPGGLTGFATPAIVLGTAAAPGSATTAVRSDATIVAFDATVPVTQALGDSAATGSATVAPRRDHKHGMPALSSATPLVESGSGAVGTAVSSSREDHVHPATTGTSGQQHILLADGHATPFVFTDLLQMDDGSDFMWSDPE